MIQRGEQRVCEHRLDDVVGREHDIPTGISAHHPRKHFLVALVYRIQHPGSEFGLKFGHGIRRDIARPVEYVQPWPAILATRRQSRGTQNERAAIHRARSLSEMRIKAPKPKTIIAEIAFTTGFTPRRAMA